jgi:hypothetical protein
MQRPLDTGVRPMSSLREIEEIKAEVIFCRDRVALLRARLYRQGAGTSPRLEELQRRLERAQQRLRAARAQAPTKPPS